MIIFAHLKVLLSDPASVVLSIRLEDRNTIMEKTIECTILANGATLVTLPLLFRNTTIDPDQKYKTENTRH